MRNCHVLLALAAIGLVGWMAADATASPYVSQGPFFAPTSSPNLPSTKNVPGKEFSDHLDRDSLGGPDPEQNIVWDGAGGTADTFDYSGSRQDDQELEVDALANSGDALFGELLQDRIGAQTNLLFSTSFDPQIYYEKPIVGGGGVWAAPHQIDNTHLPRDVDGLEIWGGDGPNFDDADCYSLQRDPGLPGAARISVWRYNPAMHQSTPWITAAQIAGAVGNPDLAPGIDLDAMMVSAGDIAEIIFSIAPIANFDGGEIWYWAVGSPTASFLRHGGHVWDTAFNVQGTFNTTTENINALEAASGIPEPSCLALVALCAVASLFGRRRSNNAV